MALFAVLMLVTFLMILSVVMVSDIDLDDDNS